MGTGGIRAKKQPPEEQSGCWRCRGTQLLWHPQECRTLPLLQWLAPERIAKHVAKPLIDSPQPPAFYALLY